MAKPRKPWWQNLPQPKMVDKRKAATEFQWILERDRHRPQIFPRPDEDGQKSMARYSIQDEYKPTTKWRQRRRFRLFPLDQLRGLPRATFDTGDPGVYFLWFGPELTYVGKATFVGTRLHQHRKDNAKPFTHATYLRAHDDIIREFECEFVLKYSPPFNFTRTG